ncbi:MAG TPA: hypothetical protein VM821_05110, partial [Abditibacteriaceae bacterium]|nr:hypothetical protein [Abditibacteriaceae bacterium]
MEKASSQMLFFAACGVSALFAGCAHTAPSSNTIRPAATVGATAQGLSWKPLYEPGSGGAMTDVSVSPFNSRRILVAGDMLGVGVSTDRGESWAATFGFKAWEMASFSWHPTKPNVVWVGSMSGPCLSTDGGVHWQEKRAGFPAPGFGYSAPIEKVLFDPNDAEHLLAIGGSSRHWSAPNKPLWGVIWESKNGGESWTRLTTITPDGSSNAANADGDNITWATFAPKSSTRLYARSDRAGMLSSNDGGKSWTRCNTGLPPTSWGRVAMHPSNPNILWASTDNYLPEGAKVRVPGGVYKTINGGKNWTNSSKGLGTLAVGDDPNQTARYAAIAVAPTNPNLLYVNTYSYNTGTTYKSEDGGANWRISVSKQNLGFEENDAAKLSAFQLETACPAGMGLSGLAFDPKNADAVYGYNTEFIPRTLDGGRTWNDATSKKSGDGWRGRGYGGWVSTNFRFNPHRRGQSI